MYVWTILANSQEKDEVKMSVNVSLSSGKCIIPPLAPGGASVGHPHATHSMHS